MSILKSTKTGIHTIPITKYTLLEKGWWISTDKNKNPVLKKDNNHFLHIFNDTSDDLYYWYIDAAKMYEFSVQTYGDLQLIEKYWNEKKINKKRKYLAQIIHDPRVQTTSLYFEWPASAAETSLEKIERRYTKPSKIFPAYS